MKFIITCLFVVLIQGVNAQVCTGNFVFHTQTEIDQFLIDNPTCTSIDGDVTIEAGPSQTSGFITNVNALQNIESITGDLYIETNSGPFSLLGLSALTTVEGDLDIRDHLYNTYLHSFSGLNNLTSVGGLSLFIHKNAGFSVFDNLSSSNGIYILMYANGQAVTLSNIFPGITELFEGFTCTIEDASTVNFSGMYNLTFAGSVYFTHYSGGVNTFDAFNSLTTVRDDLTIDVTFVNQFSGLEQLESVGWSMYLYLRTTGTGFPDFSQLVSVDQSIYIYGGGLNIPPLHFSSLVDVSQIIFEGEFPEVHFGALHSVNSLSFQEYPSWIPHGNNPTTIDFPAIYTIHFLTLDGLQSTDLSAFPLLNTLYNVDIQNCPNLTECAIEAMCERLSINPAAVTINNNAPGCNTVDEVLNDCEFSYISGQVYADLNCDGVYNTGDVHFQNSLIHNQNELPVGSINANGSYYVVIPESSTMQIHAMVPSGFLDGPEYSATYAYAEDYLNYNFPLCPDLNFHDVRVYGYLESPRPGNACEYSITLKNEVVPSESVLLTLDFSNMPGASVSSTDGTVSGNTVTWTVNDLTFMETNHFVAEFNVDPSTPLGTIFNPIVTATLLSATDDDPADNIFSLHRTVVGSYDPNDKSVNRPAIDVAEIPTDDGVWLDYTIRFQNTGTAEAITVRVDDFITENLDLTTFQSLDASHDYVVSFKEDRKVEWLFSNIMLPDSTTNEPESRGYIHFKIKTIPGLGVADMVENSVAIYFDFNAPVITNTATTIFYECTDEVNGFSDGCENGEVTLSASGVWDEYHWTIDGIDVGSTNQLTVENLAVGQENVLLHVSTTYCNDDAEYVINVAARPATPTITQTGNTLTASGSGIFEWSMNGDILPDTDNSINIDESNDYSVMVSENGCASELSSGTFDLFVCPAPLELPQDLSICVGEVVQLNVPDEYLSLEWKWQETDEVIGTDAVLSFSPTASGTIAVSGISFDCNSTDVLVVTVNPIPATPTITQTGNVLTASGSGIFEWSMNGDILTDTDNSIHIEESNDYSVTLSENGCTSELSSGTFDLFVCPAPLQLPQDMSICVGEVVQLNVLNEYLSLEWKWQETDEVIGSGAELNYLPSSSGTITISGVSFDCSSTDELFITINPLPATPVITQEGNTLTASGSGIFEWSMNGEILPDTDNSINIEESNDYSVTVSENGCTSELSSGTFDLFVCPAPLQLPQDLSICVGDVVQLNVPDEYLSLEWKWQETNEIIGSGAELNYLPSSSGTITISGVSFDCSSTDELFITINPLPATPVITQEGNTLTASGSGIFEWSMNGDILPDTDNTIHIEESNDYSVTVSENGCTSEMSSGTFNYFECPAPLELPQDLSICSGDLVQLNVPNEYLSLEWKWQETNEVIGTGAELNFSPTASGTITVSGISFDCNSTDNLVVTVNPIPSTPTITQSGNTLTASGSGIFAWSMNGNILLDTDNSINIEESNVYSVVVSENGCDSEVASGAFTYTGIEENIESHVDIFPNPASTVVNLHLPNTGTWHLEIMSSDGQLLHITQITDGKQNIDIKPEWCGLLMFKLTNENTVVQVKRKIIVVK